MLVYSRGSNWLSTVGYLTELGYALKIIVYATISDTINNIAQDNQGY